MDSALNRKIFAREAVNSGRQDEMDLARFVVMFCMPIVHCIIECMPAEALVSGIPYLFDTIIGGPFTAPLFMFVMGIGTVYSRHKSPDRLAVRGLKFLLISFVLNICRYLIPFFVGYQLTGDYEHFREPLLYLVLENDIMLFAGLSLLVIALLIRLRVPDAAAFAVSLALSLLGTSLTGTDAGSPLANIFLGYLIGTEDAAGLVHSYFPLLNWLLIPVCGHIFGKYLIRVKNKPLFYRLVSPVCLLITVIYFCFGISRGLGMFGEGENCYYHLSTMDAAASLCAAVGVLGPYYLLAPLLPKRAADVVREGSRNINAFYCIHWILLAWIIDLGFYISRGTQQLGLMETVLLGMSFSVVSLVLAHFRSLFRNGRAAGGKG